MMTYGDQEKFANGRYLLKQGDESSKLKKVEVSLSAVLVSRFDFV